MFHRRPIARSRIRALPTDMLPPSLPPYRSYAQAAASTRDPRLNLNRNRESEGHEYQDDSDRRHKSRKHTRSGDSNTGRESARRRRRSGSDNVGGCNYRSYSPTRDELFPFRRAEGRVDGFTRAHYFRTLGYFAARWLVIGNGPLTGATSMQTTRAVPILGANATSMFTEQNQSIQDFIAVIRGMRKIHRIVVEHLSL